MHRNARPFRVPMMMSLMFASAAALTACGDNKPKPSSNSIAAAFENQVDPKANAKEAGEEMRKLKEKVAADAEAAVLAEIDKITVPAGDAPTDIKAACEAMRGAYDDFMQKRLAGNADELARWNVMKPLDLDKRVEACVADNQSKVVACQLNALRTASLEVTRDRIDGVMATCTKKHGQPLAAAPGGKARPEG
jgi:hypothetical protein